MTPAKWAYLGGLVMAVIGPLGIFGIYERYGRPWSSAYFLVCMAVTLWLVWIRRAGRQRSN